MKREPLRPGRHTLPTNHSASRKGRIALLTGGILFVVLVVAYFVAQSVIRKKVQAALQNLPAAFSVTYSSINPGLLNGSLVINDLKIRFTPGPDTLHRHQVSIDQLAIHGIHFLTFLSSHRLHIGSIRLQGCSAELDDWLLDKKIPFPKMQGPSPFTELTLGQLEVMDMKAAAHKEEHREKSKETLFYEGSLRVDSIRLKNPNQPIDTGNLHIGSIHLLAEDLRYLIPGAYEKLTLKNIALNSADGSLRIDTMRISPTLDREEMGTVKETQVDWVEGVSEGIQAEGLDLPALLRQRLIAKKITIRRNNLHVFRDRRLPRDEGLKRMPVDFLKSLPISIRVRSVTFGTTSFTYEEFPKKGDKTGILKIVRLTGTLSPLINHPVEGDPAYITMVTEGSLMGSGTVTATTKMPLHKGDPYKVEGAFHELDVTTLNPSAENLGGIHLETGILNTLAFQFDMTAEKSTGRIVGEYHNLVVDKLKGNPDDKKIDKLKSFALKKFIIPLNKDHTLPESKRTGRVDYKHDPTRNFSFYLLHSLLVGVKSSFRLGFLLPG